MSIRLLMLLLRVTQVLVGVAVGFVLLGFAIHIAHGGPFTANWPVVTTDALVHPLRAGAGTIRIDRGALALASPDWRPELAQLLFVLAFAGGSDFRPHSAQACGSEHRQWGAVCSRDGAALADHRLAGHRLGGCSTLPMLW